MKRPAVAGHKTHQVEHEGRSVVVFADHFAIPYNHLIRKLSDEKVGDFFSFFFWKTLWKTGS